MSIPLPASPTMILGICHNPRPSAMIGQRLCSGGVVRRAVFVVIFLQKRHSRLNGSHRLSRNPGPAQGVAWCLISPVSEDAKPRGLVFIHAYSRQPPAEGHVIGHPIKNILSCVPPI